jgi:fumarate reductase subunit D
MAAFTDRMVRARGTVRSRLLALLSYLGVLCLVPMVFNKDDAYVDFHARQGLVLWVWGVLSIFALYLPGLGSYVFSVSYFMIAMLGLFGVVSVLFNKAWEIPVIASIARKL